MSTIPTPILVAAIDVLLAASFVVYPQKDIPQKAAFAVLITAYAVIFDLFIWSEIRLDGKAKTAQFRSIFNFSGDIVAFQSITKVELYSYRTTAASFLTADGKRRAIGHVNLSPDEAKAVADFIGVPFENIPTFADRKNRPNA